MPNKAVLIAAAAVLAVAAAIAVRSRDAPSEQLRALQTDPIAAYAPPGGELVDTDEQNEGTTLGKPVRARYTRLFAVGGANPERVLDEAIAAAEAAGWTVEGGRRQGVGGLVGLGDKRLATGRAQLGLTVFTDARVLRDGVSPPALKVSLEHLSS